MNNLYKTTIAGSYDFDTSSNQFEQGLGGTGLTLLAHFPMQLKDNVGTH